ncbi:hypothetical protein Q31a_24560 [Aureliella helgolandensis]|uniref:Uncharacterized protein n=1 Tax=Aureliella helgolandensis TaxID=2527968 RepID=A0A518G6D0_9BACT|nr:hypothetical protein Q31a_24560 [Aureliella helgolandensis]
MCQPFLTPLARLLKAASLQHERHVTGPNGIAHVARHACTWDCSEPISPIGAIHFWHYLPYSGDYLSLITGLLI